MKTILYIEDDENDAEAVTDWLQPSGYQVITTDSSDIGLTLAEAERPDLIILDIRMTTEDEGYQVLKTLQRNPQTNTIPVIIYSITGERSIERTKGLRFGAIYHLPKDPSLQELEEAVKKVFARIEQATLAKQDAYRLTFSFEPDSASIWIDGQERREIVLPHRQRLLLTYLWEHRNQICSRTAIAQFVYPDDVTSDVSKESIDAIVSRLRRNLNDSKQPHRFILTVHGSGYKLVVSERNNF